MPKLNFLALTLASAGLAFSQSWLTGSTSGNSLTFYDYPASNGVLYFNAENVPAALQANVGWQIRVMSNHGLSPMRKPIIIPEGFDADYGTTARESFDGMESKLSKVFDLNTLAPVPQTTMPNILRTLYDEGYEIILLRFMNPTASITDNSYAVQAATLKVASMLQAPNTPIRFVGPSMGGLIVRHALQTFRTRFSGQLPNINQYISFDSPHRGALIPMSVQAFIMFHSWGSSENKQKYMNILSPGAKQMLLYHEQRGAYHWDLGSASTTINGYENSTTPHGQFMQTLDNGLPELLDYARYSWTAGDISRVSIVNGAVGGTTHSLPQNTRITTLKATAIDEVGKDNMYTHGGGRTHVFDAYIDSWGGEDDQDPFSYYLHGDPCFVENAPGGSRNSYAEAAHIFERAEPTFMDYDFSDTFVDYWDPKFGPYPGNPSVKPQVTGSTAQGHSFIPTASGLGLIPSREGTNVNSTSFWFRDFRTMISNGSIRNASLFKKHYAPVKNQPHMYITTESIAWFLAELRSEPNIDRAPVTLPLM